MDNDEMECVVLAIIGCIAGIVLAVFAFLFIGV